MIELFIAIFGLGGILVAAIIQSAKAFHRTFQRQQATLRGETYTPESEEVKEKDNPFIALASLTAGKDLGTFLKTRGISVARSAEVLGVDKRTAKEIYSGGQQLTLNQAITAAHLWGFHASFYFPAEKIYGYAYAEGRPIEPNSIDKCLFSPTLPAGVLRPGMTMFYILEKKCRCTTKQYGSWIGVDEKKAYKILFDEMPLTDDIIDETELVYKVNLDCIREINKEYCNTNNR